MRRTTSTTATRCKRLEISKGRVAYEQVLAIDPAYVRARRPHLDSSPSREPRASCPARLPVCRGASGTQAWGTRCRLWARRLAPSAPAARRILQRELDPISVRQAVRAAISVPAYSRDFKGSPAASVGTDSTSIVMPSVPVTRTAWPASTGAELSARQSSAPIFTMPWGASFSRAVPKEPTMASGPLGLLPS